MCCAEIESEAGAHLVGTCVYAVLASLQVRKQRKKQTSQSVLEPSRMPILLNECTP